MSPIRRVGWATVATALPMGQQRYEVEIQRALTALYESNWIFRPLVVTSMRSGLTADRRIPQRLVNRAPRTVVDGIGAWAYRGVDLLHRFDLRLPPAKREVLTVHDMAPCRFPDEGALPSWAARSIAAAKAVIAPSRFAAAEIRDVFGRSDVQAIPHGLSEEFTDPTPATAADRRKLRIAGPFVLHAGGVTQRKNLVGLAEAWKVVSERFPDMTLVLVGPPDPRRDKAFAGLRQILSVGVLSEALVPALMASAHAVVVPSTYEGFGLPALEGMACGAPVVAAAAGALPEVCGGAAMLVDPSAEGIARGLSAVLGDERLRRELAGRGRDRAKQFSWERAARDHLAIYAEAVG